MLLFEKNMSLIRFLIIFNFAEISIYVRNYILPSKCGEIEICYIFKIKKKISKQLTKIQIY